MSRGPSSDFVAWPSSDFEHPVAAEHGRAVISSAKHALQVEGVWPGATSIRNVVHPEPHPTPAHIGDVDLVTFPLPPPYLTLPLPSSGWPLSYPYPPLALLGLALTLPLPFPWPPRAGPYPPLTLLGLALPSPHPLPSSGWPLVSPYPPLTLNSEVNMLMVRLIVGLIVMGLIVTRLIGVSSHEVNSGVNSGVNVQTS